MNPGWHRVIQRMTRPKAAAVFHELREYHLEFASVGRFLEHYEHLGLPMLRDCGFDLVGAWLQDIGPDTASTYVWLIQWENLDDRTAALEKLRMHPDYAQFGKLTGELVRTVDTRILRNLEFSPLLNRPTARMGD
jgi:hypothetical protein